MNKIKSIRVWIREKGADSQRRLLCNVARGDKFNSMPWFNAKEDISDADLIRAAEEQRNGWKLNGPYPLATFELEEMMH